MAPEAVSSAIDVFAIISLAVYNTVTKLYSFDVTLISVRML